MSESREANEESPEVPEYKRSLNTYYASGVAPCTKLSRSLQYGNLLYGPNDCLSPVLLIELLNFINPHVPPVSNLQREMNKTSLHTAESLLTHMLNTAPDRDHLKYLTKTLPISVIVQSVQVFLLRLEEPPFVATPELCEYVHQKIFWINPRHGFYGGEAYRWRRGRRLVAKCLRKITHQQLGTAVAVIKRCQRWSQEHVAYRLRENVKGDATQEYTDAVCLLSSLFGTSVIGVPKAYITRYNLRNDPCEMASLKMIMFMFLLCMVSNDQWHLFEQDALRIIDRVRSEASESAIEEEDRTDYEDFDKESTNTTSKDSRGFSKKGFSFQ